MQSFMGVLVWSSHQEINAALAVALCAAFDAAEQGGECKERAQQVAAGQIPPLYLQGLQLASWPGRCQVFLHHIVMSTHRFLNSRTQT